MLKLLDERLEEMLLVFLMSIMSILIFVQVVMRYVFSNSLVWSEELARYIFIWIVYIAISYAASKRKHVKVDAFLLFFPDRIKPYIVIVGDVFVLLFSIFVVYTSSVVTVRQIVSTQTTPALQIPIFYIYCAPAVGFLMTSFRCIQVLRERILELKGGSNE